MDARIEMRRANNEPKCANCGWWVGTTWAAGKCDRHDIKTLDMAVCGDWRDGEPAQTLIKPEHDE